MTAGDAGRGVAVMETVALVGRRSGKSMRELLIDLYGREQVEADRHSDSRMRAKLRRMMRPAEARSGAGADGAGSSSA